MAEDVTNEVINCLLKDEIRVIGLYGVGGVGKTTLAYNIHDHLLEQSNNFNGVYWVTASQDSNISNLQIKIANVVGVDISHEDGELPRASKLARTLREKGNILFFIDDVWDYIPLYKLGISQSVVDYKLVLTSRSRAVCEEMNCEKQIKVDVLPRDVAWTLFKEYLGNEKTLDPQIEEKAREITEECGGLPLAIITMESCMKVANNIEEWRDALKRLRDSRKGHEKMNSGVFPVLKFSYDHINDVQKQQCFLYCATFPEDYDIMIVNLINFFLEVGLIEEGNMVDNFDRGYTIIKELEDLSLLERRRDFHGLDIPDFVRVKMHDVIRDMALEIKRSEFMIKAGLSLHEVPEEEKWINNDLVEGTEEGKCLQLVSLMHNKIEEISISPECPKLSTLLLTNNSTLQIITDNFFMNMPALRVLNLSMTGIVNLPDSVKDLVNLSALILRKCWQLEVLPSLVNLTKLKRLDLFCTSIKQVPRGLNKLVNLRNLNMMMTGLLRLPTGILPSLRNLRSLIIDCTNGEEITSLKKLEILDVCFDDWFEYSKFVTSSSPKPNPYRIILHWEEHWIRKRMFKDRNWDYRSPAKYNTAEVYGNNLSADEYPVFVIPEDVQILNIYWMNHLRKLPFSHQLSSSSTTTLSFSCLAIISIKRCESLTSLFDGGFIRNLQSLRELTAEECRELEEMITVADEGESNGNDSFVALPKLQALKLCRLPKLKQISAKPLVCHSLEKVGIHTCGTLLSLKSLFHLHNLQVLQEVTVEYCKQIEEIFAARAVDEDENNEDVSPMALPYIRILRLQYLLNLKSISLKLLVCDSLEEVEIWECPQLKKIPSYLESINGQLSPPSSLKSINLVNTYGMFRMHTLERGEILSETKRWWESLHWDNPRAEVVLMPFTNIYKEEFPGLKVEAMR